MVKAAIFAIGSELLEGSIVDTNSAWLGSKLSKTGFNIIDVRLVRDSREALVEIMTEGLSKYDVILTTGGLGPTFDDITAETVAKACGTELAMCEEAKEHMIKWLEKRGVSIKKSHERQAMLPYGCKLFPNRQGTAMGFGMEKNGSIIISMPGVPYEMKPMFENFVMPYLMEKFQLRERYSVDVRIGGLPESDVDDVIRNMNISEEVECIINVSKGECFVKFRGFDPDHIKEYAYKIKEAFPDNFVGFGKEGLAAALIRVLKEKNMTISVAESCTGGLLGKELTEVAGSSEVFMGGVIAYSNDVKERVLRVPNNILVKYGAVSEETAKAMAIGAANIIRTRCSISVTGVAGPDGGTEEKPVGTVCIGYCINGEAVTKKYEFPGDREAVRMRTVNTALREMREMIRGR